MKKIILITIFLLSYSCAFSQEQKDEYKDYKSCTECFDQWKKTGLENYGIYSNPKKSNVVSEHLRRAVSIVGGVFISVATYVLYVKVNQAANEIH